MKGKYPREYFHNPDINKPLEEIWDDIDAYSGEFFEDEKNYHEKIDFVIPIPPLKYKNKIIKGAMFSQGLEYILKLFPQLKRIFFMGAYTMWSSYSWCDKADFYLTCYENKPREEYHKRKYQNKKDIIFIPLQDADFINEYKIAPAFNKEKNIDILSVATALEVKNLPVVAEAVKIYAKKYNRFPKTTFVLGSKLITKKEDGSLDYSKEKEGTQKQLKMVEEILKEDIKKVEFIPWLDQAELIKYYTRARCTVLASLIEGKNRSINESMSCDTPVILFKAHNQWARGNHPLFFSNSGELVEKFSPEALCDTIDKVIFNQNKYEPRKNYLIYNGRKNFVNKLANYIPYYRENLPNFNPRSFASNLWIDLACQNNYQIGYYDFLYGKNPAIFHVRGIKAIEKLADFFFKRFDIF